MTEESYSLAELVAFSISQMAKAALHSPDSDEVVLWRNLITQGRAVLGIAQPPRLDDSINPFAFKSYRELNGSNGRACTIAAITEQNLIHAKQEKTLRMYVLLPYIHTGREVSIESGTALYFRPEIAQILKEQRRANEFVHAIAVHHEHIVQKEGMAVHEYQTELSTQVSAHPIPIALRLEKKDMGITCVTYMIDDCVKRHADAIRLQNLNAESTDPCPF
jgi:hypothetical protein